VVPPEEEKTRGVKGVINLYSTLTKQGLDAKEAREPVIDLEPTTLTVDV
jgi:hypothetical protein